MPFREQTDLPVFDTGLPDLNLVQLFRRNRYVGADRLSDANQLSVGVTSRMLDTDSGRQFLSATLGQTFYFDAPRVALPDEPLQERSSSNVIGELALNAYRDWTARFAYEWDPENTRGNKSEFALQYRPAQDSVVKPSPTQSSSTSTSNACGVSCSKVWRARLDGRDVGAPLAGVFQVAETPLGEVDDLRVDIVEPQHVALLGVGRDRTGAQAHHADATRRRFERGEQFADAAFGMVVPHGDADG
ncbi:MAG: LPS-assembly protein LptD [Gammaproteobacteria bacterium]|nr:LPS-assembly protein LptD [Gammaproteobacteria bacterium]